MTKRSNLILLALAMLLALFTTFVVVSRLSDWKSTQGNGEKVSVVVVDKPIKAHSVVSASDVSVQSVSKDAIQTGAIASLDKVVGHFAASDWFAGQQVIPAMVLDDKQLSAFPLQIQQGDRAYTIADDAVTGVDHLLSPGDSVDILVTYEDKKMAAILLQNIPVLHVDNLPVQGNQATVNSTSSAQSASAPATGGVDTLTVEVTPEQAIQLEYARSFGKLHIMLRNPKDTDTSSVAPVQTPVPSH